ncbi:hypothetical protein LMG19089_02914 [Ralstonia edaphis]|uniref:hypothetical protein n=1 Tax=Ralstonia edaphi TaxID=3058599 RepID=UPI0028F612A2|nr:hypothetical protein [Ralstonia sp. LMG 6871]CAJ0701736.1 hypothetical protein LMG19089_02914 [Ralstonia sp. LMG 6871]
MELRYWNIDLTSDDLVMNCSLTRVSGATAQDAERNALALMREPALWRVTAIDRA